MNTPLDRLYVANAGNALARGVSIGLPIANQIRQRQDRQEVNRLAPQALEGDRNALLQIATVNPGAAKVVQGMGQADAEARQKGLEMMYRAATWADTPQKWDQAITWLGEQTGSTDFEQYRNRFADRDMFLSMIQQEAAKPLSGPGKVQYDINAGILPKGTPLRGAGVTVNLPGEPMIGKIPPGYQAVKTPDGGYRMEPIPGGPAAEKAAADQSAEEERRNQQVTQAGIVTQEIDRALNIVETAKIPVTGIGSFLSDMPGTKAHDLSAKLDTIKANIGFDKLQAMREASPTGGALGQVSENENRLLQSVFGSLAQSQSQEEFKYNLRRLKDTYLDIIHGPGNRPGQTTAQPGQATETKTLNGKTYMKIDGKWYEE